jgi:hypothetical protein
LGTASAETEDIGRLATAFPDGDVASGLGLFRDGFGTSRSDLTSLSVDGGIVSSPGSGSDGGAPPEGQEGGEPLFTPSELNADYSLSTLDGLFPTVVNGSGSLDSQIMNDPLFGDSDQLGGFFVNAFGSSSLGSSNLGPPEDRPGKGGSHCSSDGSQSGVQCELEGDLSSLIATSSGTASDAGYQPAQQSPILPDLSPPGGGAYPSDLEMKAAQNGFAMAWKWEMTQGIFPLACGSCVVTLPVVDSLFTPASDFGNTGGSPDSDQALDPPLDDSLANISNARPATSVPEIPAPAMLLIGFGGLALVGWRRLRGSDAAGSTVRTS